MPTKALTHLQRRPVPDARRTASRRGYDHSWAKLRAAFIAEHPMCFAPGCNEPAAVVDHRVPITVDPTLRLVWENLRPCCIRHHAIITANFRETGRNELPTVSEAR